MITCAHPRRALERRCVYACVKRVGLHTVWWNIQLSIRCVVTVCRWKRLSGGIKWAYPVTQWTWMQLPWLWCRLGHVCMCVCVCVCVGDQVTWMEGIKGLLNFTRQTGLMNVFSGGGSCPNLISPACVCDRGRAGMICCLCDRGGGVNEWGCLFWQLCSDAAH